MRFICFFLLLISISGLAEAAKVRSIAIKKKCEKEITTICKLPLKTSLKEAYTCLMRERLFVSLACEKEILYYHRNGKSLFENFVKTCKKDVLKFCTEKELAAPRETFRPACAQKIITDSFSNECKDLFQKTFK